PDLMPADIIGTQVAVLDEAGARHFRFQPGPVFTQLLLADEINRATPKTQSALLEAMEEKRVTVGRESHPLRTPFMVLATQNPIEMEGTYPLPEAQLDRFQLKLDAGFPDAEALAHIVERATGTSMPEVSSVMTGADVLRIQHLVRQVSVAQHVRDHAIRLVLATHPDNALAPPNVRRFVRYGASPRGLLSLILTAKCAAVFAGRLNVSFDDLIEGAQSCLQHRILLNFEGEAEGLPVATLIDDVLESIPVAA
ncbi:MAG: AAA family ATPase, partial [Gammaproteobacteria bacterium]|nr:AAA family ATPase [Gammaproteobacteria bacterium]